jgi:hypothetical protein
MKTITTLSMLLVLLCGLSGAAFAKSNKAPPKEAHRAPVEVPLSPAQIGLAEYVHVGVIPCELGTTVKVTADAKAPGYFHVQVKHQTFEMAAVESATGALRLEDKKAGAVWLQLANKSMLMNQKAGQRLADECKSPAQLAVAEAMKAAPAQSVLDAPAPSK